MSDPTAGDTRQCPHCGTENESGRALCQNCQTPLTAYAGQLTGEAYASRLAGQVAALETRPPIIAAVAVFNLVFALFWPLASVASAFATRQQVNAEGTNLWSAAISSIGPLFAALFLLPAAIALGVLAWATWKQRPWAWMANLFAFGLFALLQILRISFAPLRSLVLLAAAGALFIFWFRPETKAWYGKE